MLFRGMSLQKQISVLMLCGILGLLPVLAKAETPMSPADPAFQQAVEKVVEQYLRAHPEVIEQTLQALQDKREAEERDHVRKVIAIRQKDLLNDPDSPVSGNLKGDVTVVEFFDYRCGYCKRVAGAVTQLQEDDPNVRIVYKDYPILGEASEIASRAALASKAQGKHLAFHEALLAFKQDLTQESIFKIATGIGLDQERLKKDMESPSIHTTIESNRALARELGVNGTPGFIVGTELVPGALSLDGLKDLVAKSRNAK